MVTDPPPLYRFVAPDETVNVTRTNVLWEFFKYSLGVIVLILGVYFSAGFITDTLVPFASTETEEFLFDVFFEDEFQNPDPKAEPELATYEDYLQSLLDSIPKDDLPDYPYTVYLLKDDSKNALALPAGRIAITTGLIESLKSENALLFVIGHELGHIANRDHLRGLGRGLIAALFLAPVMSSDGSIVQMLQGIELSVSTHFSRADESHADQYGVNTLMKYYGHVGGATEFFTVLSNDKDSLKENALIHRYLSTHPLTTDRIQSLQKLIQAHNHPLAETKPIRPIKEKT